MTTKNKQAFPIYGQMNGKKRARDYTFRLQLINFKLSENVIELYSIQWHSLPAIAKLLAECVCRSAMLAMFAAVVSSKIFQYIHQWIDYTLCVRMTSQLSAFKLVFETKFYGIHSIQILLLLLLLYNIHIELIFLNGEAKCIKCHSIVPMFITETVCGSGRCPDPFAMAMFHSFP